MRPEEKAKELFDKFKDLTPEEFRMEYTISIILGVVEEAIKACAYIEAPNWVPEEQGVDYWTQVKEEIWKLQK